MTRLRRTALDLALAAALSFVLGASVFFACSSTYAPTPEPPPAPQEPHARAGAGLLGQLAVPIPAAVGPNTAWVTSSFVSIASAVPSEIVPGDAYSLWGSATGTGSTATAVCLDAGSACPTFVASGTTNAFGAVTWSTQPPTWQAWGYYSIQRDAGSGGTLTLYINGNLGSADSADGGATPDGGFLVAQGTVPWQVAGLDGGAVVTADAVLDEAVVPFGSSFSPSSSVMQIGAYSPSGTLTFVSVDTNGDLLVNAKQGTPNAGGSLAWPVSLDGGTVTATPPLVAALNASADQSATTTPTALTSLAAGPNGILVRSSVDNDPSSRIRVATNAANGTGVVLAPGESFVFAVANASDLLIYLQASSDAGTTIVYAEQA